jgi:hypothetical protein
MGDYDIRRIASKTRFSPCALRKIAPKTFSPQATGCLMNPLYDPRESPSDGSCFWRLRARVSVPKYHLKTQDLGFY